MFDLSCNSNTGNCVIQFVMNTPCDVLGLGFVCFLEIKDAFLMRQVKTNKTKTSHIPDLVDLVFTEWNNILLGDSLWGKKKQNNAFRV